MVHQAPLLSPTLLAWQSTSAVIHSDQGTQFTSWAFTRRAVDSGLLPSMGSVGDCFDNAVMEAFWSRVQVESPWVSWRLPRLVPSTCLHRIYGGSTSSDGNFRPAETGDLQTGLDRTPCRVVANPARVYLGRRKRWRKSDILSTAVDA